MMLYTITSLNIKYLKIMKRLNDLFPKNYKHSWEKLNKF